MYMNKNFEWMTDWEKPSWILFEGFYWVYLYNKILSQGNAKERLRLIELYNDSKARFGDDSGTIIGFLLSALSTVLAGFDHYAHACEWFIHETKMAAFQDDSDRALDIERYYKSPELIAAENRIFGDDYQTREIDNLRLENELKANHTKEQETIITDKRGYSIHPTLENAKKQKLVKSGEQYVNTAKGKTAVHYRVYDKCQGYYTAIVWADNRPLLPNGTQPVRAEFAVNFTGTASITEILPFMISAERMEAICGFKN